MAQEELAEQVVGGVAGDVEEAVAEGETDAAIIGGMIGVGDGGGGEAAEDVGVAGLRPAVVAAGADGELEGIEEALADGAGAFVEVAGILVQERGQDGAAEQAGVEVVDVFGAVAFGVALGSLTVAGIDVFGLLDAGDEAGGDVVDGGGDGRRARMYFCLL